MIGRELKLTDGRPVAILVSPGAVDGYPPVQNQARMFALNGYDVEIITQPLAWTNGRIEFEFPRVSVRSISLKKGPGTALRRLTAYVSALTMSRRRNRTRTRVEIAYDPLGIFYSDMAPFRPKLRIAQLHECLQRFETDYVEQRLSRAMDGFQLHVVPDSTRAEILQRQIPNVRAPVVVPNYPYWNGANLPERNFPQDRFEVVYCGSLGLHQKLDFIVSSIPLWPKTATLRLIGNCDTETGYMLRSLAASIGVSERVVFSGWINNENVPNELSRSNLGICLFDPQFEQLRSALSASNKRYQYMQAGLAQVGDMNPGVRELLEGQGVGQCLTSFSASELAGVIRQYVEDPARCSSESVRAVNLHRTRYNYQTDFRPVLDWLSSSDRVATVQKRA